MQNTALERSKALKGISQTVAEIYSSVLEHLTVADAGQVCIMVKLPLYASDLLVQLEDATGEEASYGPNFM